MIKAKFEGGQELADALSQLSQRVSRKVLRESLSSAAEPMRRQMEQTAPRAPGKPDLADHIVISNARGEDAQEAAIAVGPAKPYFWGGFLEFGTVHMSAQPFMRPAFDGKASISLKTLAEAIWVELAGRGIRRKTVVSETPVSGPGRLT